ncbi:MAG: DNA replication/repair protein RecF [Spirochaetales bacterium]|nr:DNA replication/repair protein RecF [Spirochaetales bacterium]
MALVQIRTFNFRNLKNNILNFSSDKIFLVGRNGQGKTNLIEAVYLLSFGSSFRTRFGKRFITTGKDKSSVSGHFIFYENKNNTEISRDIDIRIKRNGTKKILLDKKVITDRSELLNGFPCIVFSHEDMDLVLGYQEKVRRFFNQTLSLYDPVYLNLLREYYKVLKNRNILLKANNLDLINIYDQQYIPLGREIQKRRFKTVNELNIVFSGIISNISGELSGLSIDYKPSWKIDMAEEDVLLKVKNNLKKEVNLGFTISGPHKDFFKFSLRGLDFSHYASTGQLRLCSLALKVAQGQYIYKIIKRKPILLLDDVLLEMDKDKKIKFLKNLPLYEQAFFTFLPNEDFLSYTDNATEIYNVSNGNIEVWKKQEIF